MAIAAGRKLSDRLFSPNNKSSAVQSQMNFLFSNNNNKSQEEEDLPKADYDFVPSVVFSHPPIGILKNNTSFFIF